MRKTWKEIRNKVIIPGIGDGTGQAVVLTNKKLFKDTVEMVLKKFAGYHVLYYECNQSGILKDMKFDGADLIVYSKAYGLSQYFVSSEEPSVSSRLSPSSFEWFRVRNLEEIQLLGPSWGAACFGSVGLNVHFLGEGNTKYSMQLSGRINASFKRVQGAYPLEK